jgi:hypothetical protein
MKKLFAAAGGIVCVVVSGKGKGPGEKPGSGDFYNRQRNESEPLPCRKELDGVETTVVRRSWDKAPAGLAYGRSGIRHTVA